MTCEIFISRRVLALHMILVRQPPPKSRGHMLITKIIIGRSGPIGQTVRGLDDPQWRRGRSARAQNQLGFQISYGIC
jgi:hypothetical protein